MRVSPIQKYALRLLVVAGAVESKKVNWKSLDFFQAEKLLSPFGGALQAVSKIEIPQTDIVDQPDKKVMEIKNPYHNRHKNNMEME